MTSPWTPPAEERRVPGLWRIVRTDTAAGTGALVLALAWILFAGAVALGRVPLDDLADHARVDPGPLVLTGAATVVGLAVLLWRVLRIRSVFRRGRVVQATVEHVLFHRGRGRVRFRYGEHASWVAVHQTRAARLLREGDTIEVVVDPDRPTVALPRSLFL